MNGPASPAPLPDYAPVCLATQLAHARKMLAITANTVNRAVMVGRMNEIEAACEKQRAQSIVRTLEAVAGLVGPNTVVACASDLARAMA